jgi:hypothetical protein
MIRQLWTITKAWGDSLPNFQFLTTLPYITHRFITGDCPVMVFASKQNAILTPTIEAVQAITALPDLLDSPQTQFLLTLSPYIAVSLGQLGPSAPQTQLVPLDPIGVLKLNQHIRDQSQLFTLARDKESL